jgi:uncharacterized protein
MKFVVYKDRKGEWRWRLIAANARKVADSGEGYKRASGARRAALRIFDAFNSAGIETEIQS